MIVEITTVNVKNKSRFSTINVLPFFINSRNIITGLLRRWSEKKEERIEKDALGKNVRE